MQWHPDKWSAKSLAEQKEAEEKMKQINVAYEVLSDSEKRKQFDLLTDNKSNKFDPIEVIVAVGALTLILYLVSKEENKGK